MKHTIIMLAFVLFGLTSAKAQTSYSCTYRQYCYWNESTSKYANCQGYEDNSLFVINKDETMFTHTTETIKSTYYIKSKEYSEKTGLYTYFVTSDVGNKYYYTFDSKNKAVSATFKSDGKDVLLVFTVKGVF